MSRKPWRAVICLTMLTFTPGCAYVTHRPVPYKNRTEDEGGIYYYGTSLYLLVYTDGKGSLISEVKELPDQTKLMRADPFQFCAKHTTALTFNHGALTSSKSEGDSTAVPKTIIGAIEQLLPLLAAANQGRPDHEIPAPYLFKIVVEPAASGTQGEVKFIGGQPGAYQNIKVTLVPQKEAKK